jgi:hypothetical protein
MKKTNMSILLFLVVLPLAIAELAPQDVQKIVREENQRSVEEIKKYTEQTRKDIQTEVYGLANQVFDDMSEKIVKTEKKLLLIGTMSFLGIISLSQGIIGYIRIKKESNALLIMQKDMNDMKSALEENGIKLSKSAFDKSKKSAVPEPSAKSEGTVPIPKQKQKRKGLFRRKVKEKEPQDKELEDLPPPPKYKGKKEPEPNMISYSYTVENGSK